MDCCGLTKRWSLYVASTATPGSRLDLPAGRNQSLLTDSMRAVARDAVLSSSASQAPLRATCSKSQPPHLVFEYIYYCHQNLSSDHLLSGVRADYRKPDASSIRAFRSTAGDNIRAKNSSSPKKVNGSLSLRPRQVRRCGPHPGWSRLPFRQSVQAGSWSPSSTEDRSPRAGSDS